MTLLCADIDILTVAVVGRGHARAGRGSQDAVDVRLVGDAVVVAVCDGCSAGEASEVGAGVGARVATASLARRLRAGAALDEALATAMVGDVVDELARLARALGEDDELEAVVARALLFTLQVVIATPRGWLAFGIGDGVLRKDGAPIAVPEAEDGAPDCVAYRLLPTLSAHARLVVHGRGDAWSSLVVGTDGTAELERRADVVLIDGERFVGLPLFEQDERFVRNPGLARKRVLALGERGPVDDCTFVVLRRRARAVSDDTARPAGGAPCA
jgi:hypothetical protein